MLPNGKTDSIILATGDTNAKLSVWFERLGFCSDHGIIFDYSRREVDPEMISNQAILEAGPLFGRLELQGFQRKN